MELYTDEGRVYLSGWSGTAIDKDEAVLPLVASCLEWLLLSISDAV